MQGTWTADKILALAPDAGSAAAGKGLAAARKWVSMGTDDRAVWGECQGSGKDPYKTQIDTLEPAFKCSCPSRKFPCKHALGLFLLAAQPGVVAQSTAPAWVSDWLAGRAQKAEKRATKPEAAPVDAAAQAKRAAERSAKVAAGLKELSLWTKDLVRGGLAAAQAKPHAFWEAPAARMEDAQAKFVADRLRDMAGLPATGDGWPDRLLLALGRLHLLVEAYGRIDALPPDAQADVRSQIGWTLKEDEVLAGGEIVRDRWAVLGAKVDVENNRRQSRTWLRGQSTGRPALLLAFAFGAAVLEPGPPQGTEFDADLSFYPGTRPVRAAVKQRHGTPAALTTPPGYPTLMAATAAYAEALAANPWVETFPMPLTAVIPVRQGDGWAVGDEDGRIIPLAAGFPRGWELRALSGDRELALFGEFNGRTLSPMAAWADGRFVAMS